MTEFTHIAAQMFLGGLIGMIGVWFGSRATRDGYREGLAMGEAIYRGSMARPPESLDVLAMIPNSLAWKDDDQ